MTKSLAILLAGLVIAGGIFAYLQLHNVYEFVAAQETESICDDGVDNDSDGFTDCGDDDCATHHSCIPEDCSNGSDDDGDGDVDCADSECTNDSSCLSEICGNDIDDDNDGFTDCGDDECDNFHECISEDCTNGFDDDGDGKTDCADSECTSNPACIAENCTNGIDDDNDGLTDCGDDECSSHHSCIAEDCNNGVDDDGDGSTDCQDSECSSHSSCSGVENCSNGIDDDNDGLIDCSDTNDCSTYSGCIAENCTNGVDDDSDGDVDCSDSECSSHSSCLSSGGGDTTTTSDGDGGGSDSETTTAEVEEASDVATLTNVESVNTDTGFSEETEEALKEVLPEAVAVAAIATAEIADEALPAATTIVTTLVAAGAIATTAAAATATGTGFLGYIQLLLPFLSIRKKKEPWGRVVEEVSNRPIKGVIVTVFDVDGKPRATMKTRADGTFGVLLPQGTYRIIVSHEMYTFVKQPRDIALFPNEKLYNGGELKIESDEALVPIVLGVRSKQAAQAKKIVAGWLRGVGSRLKVLQTQTASQLLVVGASLNSVALIRDPSYLFLSFGVLYSLLLAMEILRTRVSQRAVGRVLDAAQGEPIPLALVRMLDLVTSRIVATAVTLPQGHFLLMPPPGRYQMQVVHRNYQPYSDKHVVVHRWASGATHLEARLKLKQDGQKPTPQPAASTPPATGQPSTQSTSPTAPPAAGSATQSGLPKPPSGWSDKGHQS